MEKIIERIKNNKFIKSTAIRCARTFLTTILGVWTAGTVITEVNWQTTLISAVSATIYIFITCLVGGLPEIKDEGVEE